MLEIRIGDIVEITGAALMELAQKEPEVFEQLRRSGVTRGPVRELAANRIAVDIGDSSDCPLTLDLDPQYPFRTIRLVQRKDQERPVDEMPPEVHVCEMGPMGMMGGYPIPGLGSSLQEAMQAAMQQRTVPVRVQVAQGVISQFLHLKQYMIIQAAQRGEGAPVEGDEWKQGYDNDEDGPHITSMRLKLDTAEQKLYERAMSVIGDWMEEKVTTQ